MNQGVRGRALMKKTRSKISRVSVPLREEHKTCFNVLTLIELNLLVELTKSLKQGLRTMNKEVSFPPSDDCTVQQFYRTTISQSRYLRISRYN